MHAFISLIDWQLLATVRSKIVGVLNHNGSEALTKHFRNSYETS